MEPSSGFWGFLFRATATALTSAWVWPADPGWGNGTWTRLTQLDMTPESGIPAPASNNWQQGFRELRAPSLFVWLCERSPGGTTHSSAPPPGSRDKTLGKKVLNNTSATTLCAWWLLCPVTSPWTNPFPHHSEKNWNSPCKATTTQILQDRFWVCACLPNATDLPWQCKSKALLHPSASCFHSPCPCHEHTSRCIYPFKHIPACLLWVPALTAHHPVFIFVLEIGLVSSQTDMLLQMNQDFSLLGVYIGEIGNCVWSL